MIRLLKLPAKFLVGIYNSFIPKNAVTDSGNTSLNEIREYASKRTDISDHLEILYLEATRIRPELILELGVRTGESTFALERAARQTDATLISLDMEPTSYVSDWENWYFVQEDDLKFAHRFHLFAVERGLKPEIDFLFLDTSHTYEHTKRELDVWLPFLSTTGIAVFHDTNLGWLFRRRDGSIGGGWNNSRGVIRALQEYLGVSWDEKAHYSGENGTFAIEHIPDCNGLTILRKKH